MENAADDAADDVARPSARADFYGGLGWIALGIVIGVASWRMDRLERMGVSFFTAPGALQTQQPRLYEVLRNYYNQDPAARQS